MIAVMLFPFRSSSIFRNRWIALLWAAGICFAASEIVDTVAPVTAKNDAARSAVVASEPAVVTGAVDPVATVLGAPPPGDPPVIAPPAR